MKLTLITFLITGTIFLQISQLTHCSTPTPLKQVETHGPITHKNNTIFPEKQSKEKKELSGFAQFSKSFVLNFFSEIGDKSFLCIIFIYNQVSPCVLFVVASFAELLMNFFSVVIGYELSDTLSVKFFQFLGMICFIGFGIMLLIEIFSQEEEEEKSHLTQNNTNNEGESQTWIYTKQILKIAGIIFIAELGDKSQITTIILSTEYNPVYIFLGTAVAHMLGIGISIFLGYLISNKLSKNTLTIIGAIAFLLFGIEMGVKYFSSNNVK